MVGLPAWLLDLTDYSINIVSMVVMCTFGFSAVWVYSFNPHISEKPL